MNHPDWVLKHKTKGTEIRKLGKYYYLYKIRSEYDKEKKRAKKITEKFLG
ncbi:MAG TPA: IS1634 family transposase, partial [Candidatus Methanoperedens sp.]